ncbi:MAG: hypothetical protein QM680_00345 [Luteolibacter sp.]
MGKAIGITPTIVQSTAPDREYFGLTAKRAAEIKREIARNPEFKKLYEGHLEKVYGIAEQRAHDQRVSDLESQAANELIEAHPEHEADFRQAFDEIATASFSVGKAPYGIAKEGNRVVSANESVRADWDKAVVTKITGKEIFPERMPEKIRETLLFVKQWGEDNGLFAEHPTPALGGDAQVSITRTKIKNDLSHGAGPGKISSVAGLPGMLKNAVIIQTEVAADAPNSKDHILAAKLDQNGTHHTVSIVVKERDGLFFYDHEFVENGKSESTHEVAGRITTGALRSEDSLSAGKVVRAALGVNPSFSAALAPAQVASALQGDIISRIRNPEARALAYRKAGEKLGELRESLSELSERKTSKQIREEGEERRKSAAGEQRTLASIRKEAGMRYVLRREELENEVMERHGAAIAAEDMAKLKSQPVHEYLSSPDSPLKGRLMSASKAVKTHPDMFERDRAGEYDGAGGVSRTVFGGDLMPDQAAQELYENGLIKEPTPDAMWDALRKEQNSVRSIRE